MPMLPPPIIDIPCTVIEKYERLKKVNPAIEILAKTFDLTIDL